MTFLSEKTKDPGRIGKFNLLLTATVYHLCFLSSYPIIKEISVQKENKFEVLLQLLRIKPISKLLSLVYAAQLRVLSNSFLLSIAVSPLVIHWYQLLIQFLLFVTLGEIAILVSLVIATLLPFCYEYKFIICQILPVFIQIAHSQKCPGSYIIPYNILCEKTSNEEVYIAGIVGVAIIIIVSIIYSKTQTFSVNKKKKDQLIESDNSLINIQDVSYLKFNNLNIQIKQGEILSIIGLNNSGKSTLLQLISGIIQPSSGSVTIFGFSTRDQQCPSIFLSQQKDFLLGKLSPAQSLEMIYDLSSQDKEEKELRVNQLLNQLFTNSEKRQPVSQLSYGTRKKLQIAMALISDAQVILLDEPFVGIDEIYKEKIFKLVKKEVTNQKKTLIYTTSQFCHVVHLADFACILKDFKVSQALSMNELRDEHCYSYRIYLNPLSQFAQLNSLQQQHLIKEFKKQFSNSCIQLKDQAIMIPHTQMQKTLEYIQDNISQYEQFFNIEIVRNNEEEAYQHIISDEVINNQEEYMSQFAINSRESVDQFVRNQQEEVIAKQRNSRIFIKNNFYNLCKALIIISPWTINSAFQNKKVEALMILYVLNICVCLSLFQQTLQNQFQTRLRHQLHLLGIKSSSYINSLLQSDISMFTLGLLLNTVVAILMTSQNIDNIIFFVCTCSIFLEMLSLSYLLSIASNYNENLAFYQTALMFMFGFMPTVSEDFLFDSELKYRKSLETLVFINPITFLYWSSDEPRNRFYYVEFKGIYLIFHILLGVCFYFLAVMLERKQFEINNSNQNQLEDQAKVVINKIQYKHIINSIDLEVNEDQVLGIIGVNGSGKSKLIEVISGVIKQDSGQIMINNLQSQINKSASKIASVFEGETFFRDRTVRENLDLILNVRNIPHELRESIMSDDINTLDLEPFLNSKVKDLGYSSQEKVKTLISLTMDQPIIFMDDPARQFDYQSRLKFQQYIKNIRQKTIIYATNNIEEAEQISDQIVMIKDGSIKKIGSQKERLGQGSQEQYFKIILNQKSKIQKIISKLEQKYSSYLQLTKSQLPIKPESQEDQRYGDSECLHHYFNCSTKNDHCEFIEYRLTDYSQNQQYQRIIIELIKDMIIKQQRGKIKDFFIHSSNIHQVMHRMNRY